MTVPTPTPINLYNAGLFSALAYAPNGVTNADSMAWALTQSPTSAVYHDAQVLQGMGWFDITAQALAASDLPAGAFENGKTNTAFHVFENSQTHQIVFVFRGSTSPVTSLKNWAADLTPTDQGYSSYQGIGPLAQALYNKMTQSGSPYSGDTFIADGHSLGGGIAQTFAVQNSINGFGQDPLPISPGEVTALGSAAITNYQNNFSFQSEELQGDVAAADFAGGTYAYKNIALWLDSSYATTENKLVSELNSKWISAIPLSTTLIDVGLLRTAIDGHSLDTLNAQAATQVSANGTILKSGAADNTTTQAAIRGLITTLTGFLPIQSILGNIEAQVNGNLVGASGAPQTDNAGNSTSGDIGVSGLGVPLDVITGSSDETSALKGDAATDLIIAGGQTTQILAGSGTDYLVGGPGNSTLVGGGGTDTFIDDISQNTGASTETITNPNGTGAVFINSATACTSLSGGAAVANSPDVWRDANGTVYTFNGAPNSAIGTLTISGGLLNNGYANTIVINDFNLASANTQTGFMGIVLADVPTLNASANAGVDPPAPNFMEGSNQSYTLSVDAPSAAAQIFTVTLSGALPSDFEVSVGDTIEQLNSNGTFNVSLAAGETNVSFGLIDVTDDNGSSDIAMGAINGANLQLNASLPNPNTLVGGTIQTAPLTFSYVPTPWNTAAQTPPSDTITGILTGSITTYTGDGGNDYIATTGANNVVNAQNSGNDSIVGNSSPNAINGGNGNDIIVGNGGTDIILVGDGNNEIYAGAQTSLQNAITQSAAATATGAQGDFIGVLDGSNTIIGGDGNDLITAGAGNDVVVLGPGNDGFIGGWESTSVASSWSFSVSSAGIAINNDFDYLENYSNPYSQPYNGNFQLSGSATGTNGPANDSIVAGKGNDNINLGNGNNYVDMGTGNTSVYGGMGNDTVIAGSGNDFIKGGGGTTYIEGGAGVDTMYGGDGNNTVIGGSGNATIFSATYYNVTKGQYSTSFANANLDQNYVTGGSGNDLIFGSAGQDTLIAGTGNTTIVGGTGTENIVGGSGNDYFEGGGGNDTIAAGGSGTDTMYADGSTSSTSVLYGGDGTDEILGGSGTNILNAGDGGTASAATSVFGTQSDATATTTINGGLGIDFLEAGVGSNVVYGGNGGTSAAPDTLIGYLTGNDTLYGGLGTDIVQGGSGTNVLYAGDGGTAAAPTTVFGGSGVSTLYGGAGNSLLEDNASIGSDLLVSTTGNDSLLGSGNDTLIAGTGNDVLQTNGGSVNVEINAGFGNDTLLANGGTANLLLGADLLATDFTGSVTFDASGNSYLNLTGDGGSMAIEDGLTGVLASAAYADPSSIPLPTLMTDAFGSDQTFTSGSSSFFVNVDNNASITTTNSGDSVSSWGNAVTINGGQLGNQVYSAGASALINSAGYDAITATGNNDTVNGGTYGADNITLSGANSVATAGAAIYGNTATAITAAGTNDTIVSNSGSVESVITVNSASTVIEVAASAGAAFVSASVSYTVPTNVSNLTLIGSANITATGNATADSITGGAGADTLIAGAGIDTLVGGSGNTTFVINNAADVIRDNYATNNTVQSDLNYTLLADVNTLALTGTAALVGTANSGNDTLISNTGIDTLIGGSGNDTFILNNASDVVQDTAGTATIVYAASASFTLPANLNVLTLQGSAAIRATGNAGNDIITANSGGDTLTAGSGSDTLVSTVGTTVESLVGGTGNDVFVVNYSGDIVSVGSSHGTDTIESSVSYTAASNVADLILIGTASIAATGNTLANTLTAATGNDTLIAGSGLATLVSGAGNDLFVVNNANDVVQDSATTTSDTISSGVNYSLPTNVNVLLLTGSASITGLANNGNDTLIANSGVDTLVGGTGNDTFVISIAGDVVQDTSTSATNIIYSSANYSLPTDVNALTLTGTTALQAAGNSANDVMIANSGADTLIAGSGTDTLISSNDSTIESLVGGTGADLFIVNGASDIVTVGGTHGADTIQSSVSYTLPTNVNILSLTGTANLVGTAVNGNNAITGNGGSDTLRAGSGSDTLIAGGAADTLIGGSGTDTFVINNSADVLQSISSAAGNTVDSSVSYSMATNITVLTLTGAGNLAATGNGASNTIAANSGADTLTAGVGVADLIGGLGADLFVINNVGDVINEPYSGQKAAVDTISSSISYTLPGTVNVLLLTGSANLTGTANGHADSIIGNAGQDQLTAGIGNDTLVAGSGIATLTGGGGSDTFVINSTSDVVRDSISGQNNELFSSVSVTLPTNVNVLLLTGSGSLVATANGANDLLKGNAGTNTLIGGAGSDTLTAGSGIDTLVGGTGTDTFIVNNSADAIQSASSSSQNSVFSSATFVLPTNVNILSLTGIANITGTGNAAADTLTAGAGQDTLIAGSGVATLVGGIGNDTFVVDSASDVVEDTTTAASNTVQSNINFVLPTNVNTLVLTGSGALEGTANGGNDTLSSNTGVDTLVGGGGNDTFVINNSGDVVQDTATGASNTAQSSVNYALANNVNTLVLTGTANLMGSANSGADTLISNAGADTLTGNTGNDTFIVTNALDVVHDSSTTAANSILSSVSYTLPTDVNALTLTGTGALSATGNGGADVLVANTGADTLTAGAGIATLIGGAGNDTFVVDSTSDVVQETATMANNTLLSAVSYSLATNVNSLVLTGTAALAGTANSGSDTLTSNAGADTLIAGSGNDIFIVNNSADVIENATANDTIESSVNYTLPSAVNTLILIGSANIVGTGNSNADILNAAAGIDTLIAGAGIATLTGGGGNDTFIVNNVNDVVEDSSTTTSNTIQSSVNFSLPTDVDTLTLTGTTGLTATGNSDATNVLTASSGNDLIVGSAFSNTINGGTGSDTLDAGPETNLIYAGNGGTTAHPTYVYGNAINTNSATQSTIYGGSGTDVLYGGPGSDVIYAGTGTDSLYAGRGFDSLYGAAGSIIQDSVGGYDLLVAGAGAETLSGLGADTFVAGTGANLLLDTATTGTAGTFECNSGFGQDTISTNGATGENLVFGAGIAPSNLQITASAGASGLQLVINDGTGSITIPAFSQTTFGTITFASSGQESLAQLMTLDGPALDVVQVPGQGDEILSAGDSLAINADSSNYALYAYGSNDLIVTSSQADQLYAYGNSDTLTASGNSDGVFTYGNNDSISVTQGSLLAQGGADSIDIGAGYAVTLVGANSTVSGSGSNEFYVYQSPTVIQESAGATSNRIDSYVSYTLPANVQILALHGNSLAASSNSQGGTLIATGNYDTLTGGAGVDSLVAQGANDSIIGGSGAETYDLYSPTDVVQFGTGNASLNSVQSYFSYTLSSSANTLTLEASSLVGAGNSGNDLIGDYGNVAYNTLIAGAGVDTLIGNQLGVGPDTLVGGSGNDTFVTDFSTDVILDTYTTTSNTLNSGVSYTLPTNVNTLNLTGSGVIGTANSASDLMSATGSRDTLSGGSGNDTLVASGSGSVFDALVAGSGQDVLEDATGGPSTIFVFNSGFSHDQIITATNGDTIQFGAGISESNLTFSALPGTGGAPPSLVISGDGGSVTVQGGFAPGAISSVNFTGGSNYTLQQLLDPSGRVTIAGANGNLILSANNADSLTAGSGNDTVIAWGNTDTLNAGTGGTLIYAEGTGDKVTGGAGTDSLVAYGASNTLIGGSGNENLLVDTATTVVNVSAGVGHDTVFSAVSYTVPTNVANMTLTGTASLTATGNTGNDSIVGNTGGDTFYAGTGVDTFVGNGGSSAAGDSFYLFGNSSDIVQVATPGHEVIYADASYSLPTNVNSLDLLGGGHTGTGNSQADFLAIDPTAGGDTLISGSGIDTLSTSSANNVLVINNSADSVGDTGANDTIQSSVSSTITGAFGTSSDVWQLTGSANLVVNDQAALYLQIVSNAGNDTLTAASGTSSNTSQDTLVGGSGTDVLIGGNAYAATTFVTGSGTDTMIGGVAGSGIYTINNSADVIVAQANPYNVIYAYASYSLPASINDIYLETAGLVATGNSNNAYLEADGGNDTLVAGSGNDTLWSYVGVNTLIGGTGNDQFYDNAGDTLILNSGFGNSQVTLAGGTGAITIRFGAGISASSLAASAVLDVNGDAALAISDGAEAVTLDGALSGQPYQFNFNGGSTLTLAQFLAQVNITTSSIAGAAGNVILEGNASTSVAGGIGKDTIYAAGTYDTITGGSGNQVLDALGVNESVVGGSASDTLTGLGTNDTLVGGSAVDTLVGGTGASVEFVINGTSDPIQLQSSPGSDTISASANYSLPTNINTLLLTGTAALKGIANNGSDTLWSNSGLDTLVGSTGNDTFVINNSADVVTDTSTTASNTIQTGFNYTLPPDVNNLLLTGTSALKGTANGGADTLTSNTGLDTLVASTGNDTFVINNSADVVTDTSTTASNTIQTGFSYSLPTDINSLVLTGTAALTGTANSSTDTLTSNAGIDTLIGGSGNDNFVINNASDVVTDTSTTASNTISSAVNYTLPTNVNALVFMGTSALMGTANSGNDSLTANSGADTLVAGSGTDTLISGTSGADNLVGGSGSDTFLVNNTADIITDSSSTATNTVDSSVSYTLPTNVSALVLVGTSALKGTANSGNDSMTANIGNDTLVAGSGTDTLVAGTTGTDSLVGGSGNDTFVVNNTADIVTDTSPTATNTVLSVVAYTLPTNVNTLTFTGTSALKGTANSGNDSLTANSGADTLVAGSGVDTLTAGITGTDSLVGGSGNDTFFVNNVADIVSDTSTTAHNTISSTVAYTLPTNVNALIFTGTSALKGTANSGNDSLTANTGADTLVAGSGVDTLVAGTTGTDSLVGGSGNDTFVVNNTSDVITDTSTTASNTLQSSVTYTLPTNVNTLVLAGTLALNATGNTHTNSITANGGADTVTAGSGVATLIGGAGNDTFVLNSASDVVTDTSTSTSNTISSTVTYTLPTNVNALILTGTAALHGTGNAGNDLLTANTGADTLSAGNGNDTLVAGATGIDSLVGGTGTDTFVVTSASDIVNVATSGTSDTIQSSASTYTLPTNVQYLMLAGTSALSGTGNTATSLIVGNTGNDTLTGGTGIAALEGGASAGSDQIKASSNQAALIAGGGSSTLTGGAFKDFYAAGKVSDSITTGATANVVSVNKGDGATTLAPTTSATNVLSLGAGIDTESMFFTKTGNNLILTDGVSGDSITFTNWYMGSADQTTKTLQVVEIASANYNSGGGDGLRNKALEAFNFTALVAAYNTAGSPANWALSTDMASAQLTSSSTADYGGDLAYYFGLNGNLTGVDLSAVQSTLTNASYGSATQTIDAFSSISGGGGLHLLVTKPGGATPPIVGPTVGKIVPAIVILPQMETTVPAYGQLVSEASTSPELVNIRLSAHLPELRPATQPPQISPTSITPRWGIQDPRRGEVLGMAAFTPVTALDAVRVVKGLEARQPTKQTAATSIEVPISQQFVDPINLAWLRMHGALDEINDGKPGGAESVAEHDDMATDALLGTVTPDRTRRTIGDAGLESALFRRRTM
jgi:trimeric autotransporter adhesin